MTILLFFLIGIISSQQEILPFTFYNTNSQASKVNSTAVLIINGVQDILYNIETHEYVLYNAYSHIRKERASNLNNPLCRRGINVIFR